MTSLAHPNLLSAMGVVSDDQDPPRPRIVYMYYPSVNLKRSVLQRCCRDVGDAVMHGNGDFLIFRGCCFSCKNHCRFCCVKRIRLMSG